MSKVITVQLMQQWINPRVTTYQIPRIAICLEGPIYYGKIEKEMISIGWYGYKHKHEKYKLSEYFNSTFQGYHSLQSIDKKYECYIILLGDEKMMVDSEEIIDNKF